MEQFTAGLRDGGHTNEVDDSIPDDVLEQMSLKERLIGTARDPLRRLMLKWWIGDRTAREIIPKLRAVGGPKDVAAQQAKVARAEALAFISPVYFVGFPAILKGWI